MTEPEFDIAIIGGGAAGCILAARLSEDPRRRVALFEAGADTPPDAVPADIRDPFPIAYSNPAYFWPGLTAVGLTGMPPSNYVQPRIMGGGSSVMGMWALRGMPHDYDAWREVGATGWGGTMCCRPSIGSSTISTLQGRSTDRMAQSPCDATRQTSGPVLRELCCRRPSVEACPFVTTSTPISRMAFFQSQWRMTAIVGSRARPAISRSKFVAAQI